MRSIFILALLLIYNCALAQSSSREERLRSLVSELASKGHSQVYFASVYQLVTTGLRSKITNREFVQNECMELLLNQFLKMYFDAFDAPWKAPRAWQEAFSASTKPTTNLLLGLNAHISHDLPISMWRVTKKYPECSEERMRSDYFSLNNFFAKLVPTLNKELKRLNHLQPRKNPKVFDKIAVKTITKFIVLMRRNAWVDYQKLESENDQLSQNKIKASIKLKAYNRAKIFKRLSIVTPEAGY